MADSRGDLGSYELLSQTDVPSVSRSRQMPIDLPDTSSLATLPEPRSSTPVRPVPKEIDKSKWKPLIGTPSKAAIPENILVPDPATPRTVSDTDSPSQLGSSEEISFIHRRRRGEYVSRPPILNIGRSLSLAHSNAESDNMDHSGTDISSSSRLNNENRNPNASSLKRWNGRHGKGPADKEASQIAETSGESPLEVIVTQDIDPTPYSGDGLPSQRRRSVVQSKSTPILGLSAINTHNHFQPSDTIAPNLSQPDILGSSANDMAGLAQLHGSPRATENIYTGSQRPHHAFGEASQTEITEELSTAKQTRANSVHSTDLPQEESDTSGAESCVAGPSRQPPGSNAPNVPPGSNASNVPSGVNASNVPPGTNASNVPPAVNASNVPPGTNASNVPNTGPPPYAYIEKPVVDHLRREELEFYGDLRVAPTTNSNVKTRIEVGSRVVFVGLTRCPNEAGEGVYEVGVPLASHFFVAHIFNDNWALLIKLDVGLRLNRGGRTRRLFDLLRRSSDPRMVSYGGTPSVVVRPHPVIVIYAPLCAFTLSENFRSFQARRGAMGPATINLTTWQGGVVLAAMRRSSSNFEIDARRTGKVCIPLYVYRKYREFCHHSFETLKNLDDNAVVVEASRNNSSVPGRSTNTGGLSRGSGSGNATGRQQRSLGSKSSTGRSVKNTANRFKGIFKISGHSTKEPPRRIPRLKSSFLPPLPRQVPFGGFERGMFPSPETSPVFSSPSPSIMTADPNIPLLDNAYQGDNVPLLSDQGHLQSPGEPQSPGEIQSLSELQSLGNIQSPGVLESAGNLQSADNLQSAGNLQSPGVLESPGNIQSAGELESAGNLQLTGNLQSTSGDPIKSSSAVESNAGQVEGEAHPGTLVTPNWMVPPREDEEIYPNLDLPPNQVSGEFPLMIQRKAASLPSRVKNAIKGATSNDSKEGSMKHLGATLRRHFGGNADTSKPEEAGDEQRGSTRKSLTSAWNSIKPSHRRRQSILPGASSQSNQPGIFDGENVPAPGQPLPITTQGSGSLPVPGSLRGHLRNVAPGLAVLSSLNNAPSNEEA